MFFSFPPKTIESPYFPFLADTETGPGVLETALAYTTALRMADNATLFKYTAKSVGMTYGIIPSFMAKPWGGVSVFITQKSLTEYFLPSFLDAAGAAFFSSSRCFIDQNVESHVHISLKNNEGRNIFSVSEAELQTGRANAANGDTKYISQEAEWFLAGILDGIADGTLSVLFLCLPSID
jgi:glutamine synthetase